MFKYLVFSFIILISINLHDVRPMEATEDICKTLNPNYFNALPQFLPSPYELRINNVNVSSKGRVRVTVHGTETFQGFILQARDMQNMVFGYFDPHPNGRIMDCPPGKDNTVIHSDNTSMFSAVFTWNPDGFEGQAFFVGTIVKTGPIFWTNLKSPTFHISTAFDAPLEEATPFRL